MSVAQRIREIKESLPEGVRLLAVSKFHPAESIMEAYNEGQRLFGENHVQELMQKQQILPADIEWHFIGHLQSNKVKYIVPFVSLIHSVDTEKLLGVINTQAEKCGRVVECLLEIHVAQEETKYGFDFDSAKELLESGRLNALKNVSVVGIMGMSSITDDESQVRREFASLSSFYRSMKESVAPQFRELSMGMSGDYHIAIEEGSTIIRLGTTIFGARQY
ncbi:MAG: YggS family pyridoxal phosphate-dependent enzyme [Paludibacteraceae bacterium]|nr:YggS family pyridoxal phosphate-dependent enzyme [Paludibacteraceae bacterium]